MVLNKEFRRNFQLKSDLPNAFHGVIRNPKYFADADAALEYISNMYNENVARLKEIAIHDGDFSHNVTYPYIGIYVDKDRDGLLAGSYGTTVSHTDVLYDYYKEQFRAIRTNHNLPIWIGSSDYPMSLTFIDEDLFNNVAIKKKICPSHLPCMKRIQRGLNGLHEANQIQPLSVFHGERTGYSLNRLHHYCGTDAKYFQNTVIFVNYHLYIDLFIEYAKEKISNGEYDEFIGPGLRISRSDGFVYEHKGFNPQMPAYHLIGKEKNGITLVNVNVGPSNVKTITDHIAVLRSKTWVMLGHCAGLRRENRIGDYVIAHNYLRYDYVLDQYIPKHIPVPSSNHLLNIFLEIAQPYLNSDENKISTGTVVTTCDRNWELNPVMVDEFSEAKAIGIDMESATVAANAFRFGVESIAFLCISDMPLHGAPKLRSMAKEFYQTKVHDHFYICMDALTRSNSELRNYDCTQYKNSAPFSTPFR